MANLLYIDQRRLYFWKISCICFFFLLFSVTAYAQNISGKVVEQHDLGSHTLFIAEVVDAKLLSDNEPLTYADYQNNVKPIRKNE